MRHRCRRCRADGRATACMSRSSSASNPSRREGGPRAPARRVGYTAAMTGSRSRRLLILRATMAAALAAGVITPVALLRAQEPPNDIRLRIEGEAVKKTPLAITPVGAPSGGALDDIATEMRQVLVDDLTYSG